MTFTKSSGLDRGGRPAEDGRKTCHSVGHAHYAGMGRRLVHALCACALAASFGSSALGAEGRGKREGFVVEATSSNLFWIADGVVWSPPLASGILPGVTRGLVFELCQNLGLGVREGNVSALELQQAQGSFLSLSSTGIAQAISLDGKELARSPLVGALSRSYWDLVREESG